MLVVLASTELLNSSGSFAFNENRETYWIFLLYLLFGCILASAAQEFILGMALVTDTSSAYISSNICNRAWTLIAVFFLLAFFVFPLCTFVRGRLWRWIERDIGVEYSLLSFMFVNIMLIMFSCWKMIHYQHDAKTFTLSW
jgi:hypothetical protein